MWYGGVKMAEFQYIDGDYGGLIAKELYKLQQENILCDTVIHVRDGQIRVHGVVLLASRCHVFGNLCLDQTTNHHIHCLMNERMSVVQRLVELLYTGQITCTGIQDTNQLRRLFCQLKLYKAIEKLDSIISAMFEHEQGLIAPCGEMGTFEQVNSEPVNTPSIPYKGNELPLNQYVVQQKIMSSQIPELFHQNLVGPESSVVPADQTTINHKPDLSQNPLMQESIQNITANETLHNGLLSSLNSEQQHVGRSQIHGNFCIGGNTSLQQTQDSRFQTLMTGDSIQFTQNGSHNTVDTIHCEAKADNSGTTTPQTLDNRKQREIAAAGSMDDNSITQVLSTNERSNIAIGLLNNSKDSDDNIHNMDSTEKGVKATTSNCILNENSESLENEEHVRNIAEGNEFLFTKEERKNLQDSRADRRLRSKKSVEIVENYKNCDAEGMDDDDVDDKNDDMSDNGDSDPDYICNTSSTKMIKISSEKIASQLKAKHELFGMRTRSRSNRLKSVQKESETGLTLKRRGRPRKIKMEDDENNKRKNPKKEQKSTDTCESNSNFVAKKEKKVKRNISHNNNNNDKKSPVTKKKKKITSTSNNLETVESNISLKNVKVTVKEYRSRGVCYLCDEVFGNAAGLKHHYRTSHDKVIQCVKCEERMDINKLYRHYRQKHLVVCETCGFRSKGTKKIEDRFADHKLKAHGEIHSAKRYPVLSCPEEGCQFKSVIKAQISFHRKMVHMPWQHICEICGKAAANSTNLRFHIEKVHQKSKIEFNFQCQVCPKKFATKGYLSAHMKFHNKELLCHLCSKCCSTRTDLAVHLYTRHDIVSPNLRLRQCPYCDYKNYSSWAFKSHVASKHGGTKDFVCKDCGKDFYAAKNLHDHMKIHIGKKYQCPVEGCTFTTIYKSALYRCHVPTVHTEKDIKNSVCHLCDYRCKNNHTLKTHIKLKHKVCLTGAEIKQIQAQIHAPVREEETMIPPSGTRDVLQDLSSVQQLETETINQTISSLLP